MHGGVIRLEEWSWGMRLKREDRKQSVRQLNIPGRQRNADAKSAIDHVGLELRGEAHVTFYHLKKV
jgi:hypothetical protein